MPAGTDQALRDTRLVLSLCSLVADREGTATQIKEWNAAIEKLKAAHAALSEKEQQIARKSLEFNDREARLREREEQAAQRENGLKEQDAVIAARLAAAEQRLAEIDEVRAALQTRLVA
jgi:hypothetical protein